MNSLRVLAVALAIGLMMELIWLVMSPGGNLVYADDGFPDRTPPTRTTVVSGNERHHDYPTGSHIELVATGFPGEWSTVQWQDVNGDWQNVGGWSGTLDEWGTRRWWVAAKDFGTGPFRWVVGAPSSPAPVMISEPFYLPAVGAETVLVSISAE